MKKIFFLLFVMFLILSCKKDNENIDILKLNWDKIEENARGKKVKMYMWGGSIEINNYMDKIVKPYLLKQNNIKLSIVPIIDIKDIVNKLIIEKKSNKKNGSVDIIWINGENFKLAKNSGILFGDINSVLPAIKKYVNEESCKLDFGEPINGLEAPWGEAQFVFIHDKDKTDNPPLTAEELFKWVKNNPGKFTYPSPPDFIGSAFIRHIIFELTGGYNNYLKPFNESLLNEKLIPVWKYFNDIKPYLWREGLTYPESSSKLDLLYSNSEVFITMNYNPNIADLKIKNGEFPPSSKTYLLKNGTLFNNHYLSIPFNSSEKEAALVAINLLISPYLQYEKSKPENWGELSIIDNNKLDNDLKKYVLNKEISDSSLSIDELKNNRIPEISALYVNYFEKEWFKNVGSKDSK